MSLRNIMLLFSISFISFTTGCASPQPVDNLNDTSHRSQREVAKNAKYDFFEGDVKILAYENQNGST